MTDLMPRPAELPPQYDPAATEQAIYARWMAAGAFTADAARSSRAGGDRAPFTIVIPPPNVTAVLHVGHGLNNTVQDVLVRWARMRGAEALWVPGTDHAGIATQNVVEKQLAAEGRTRHDVGRDAFVARVEGFVEETGGQILEQLRAIGASADWSRTAYTLSPALSAAVREAFVRLFERGLIYRDYRVIHWCPRCQTSLSDEEAEFEDETGALYHISYPAVGVPGHGVTVATTRPETMLGDAAVAVHPDDARYAALVGQEVTLPLVGVRIPVIADAYADPAFGTGVVKITPAHDANDFDVGKRHRLPMPIVIDAEGIVREVSDDAAGRVPDALRGLDRFAARERVVAMLQEAGALVKVERHQHAVRHCYRCDTVVEPRLSEQWFVRMASLAAPALAGVRDGTVRILPERWEAVYVNWLENIRDWNISRQIWWGHRVPVWYCDACPEPRRVHASRTDLTACPACGGPVRQDPDVLDTWFSSWLWPLSTLGWPDARAKDLKAFYPTDMLVTAPEILFFWVARMIMAGYEFMGRAPFHTVYLHGTVRDTEHRKMSKSLGNGVDPLDVVRLYGADALRWTLVSGMGLGTDVILDPADLDKSFAPGRNFATKLWNIGRFLLQNVGTDPVQPLATLDRARLTTADHWILERLDAAVRECDGALGPLRPGGPGAAGSDPRAADPRWAEHERNAGLRLNEYAESARRFVWNELADWYLEAAKARLQAPVGEADGAAGRQPRDAADRDVARAVLAHAFDQALRLLHPIVPFITEALWQRLPGTPDGALLARAAWPERVATIDQASAARFQLVQSAVVAIRGIRSDNHIPPGKFIDVVLVAPGGSDARVTFETESALIGRLARATPSLADGAPVAAAAHAVLSGEAAVAVPLAGLVDVEKECAKLRDELAALVKQLTALEGRLNNPGFTGRAPAAVVEGERRKRDEWIARRAQLSDRVRALCGA